MLRPVHKEDENQILNEYYCPELFELINKKLYIYPLWTGYFLPKTYSLVDNLLKDKQPTRLTNNCVENWFNQLKNNILMCSKKQNIKKKQCQVSLLLFLIIF